jgi:hypothetical protein
VMGLSALKGMVKRHIPRPVLDALRPLVGAARSNMSSASGVMIAAWDDVFWAKNASIFVDERAHIWAGYYDVCPLSQDGRILICHRVEMNNETPHGANRELEVGYFKLDARRPSFTSIGVTNAWNWQQGARLQWWDDGRSVIYNQFNDGKYSAVIQDIETKAVMSQFDVPIYAVSPDRSTALTLNFARLHRLRQGYGYSQCPDETQGNLAPSSDGVFIYDVKTGTQKLLFSLDFLATYDVLSTMSGAEHYVNHLDFSPSGKRIVFMHLWVKDGKRRSRIIVTDANGGSLHAPHNYGTDSHHAWCDDDNLLIFTREDTTPYQYYLFNLNDNSKHVWGQKHLKKDGHPSFVNESILLTDSYPDASRLQTLVLCTQVGEGYRKLKRFFSPKNYTGEVRCDLHPRLSSAKDRVCVDVVRNGRRAIQVLHIVDHKAQLER